MIGLLPQDEVHSTLPQLQASRTRLNGTSSLLMPSQEAGSCVQPLESQAWLPGKLLWQHASPTTGFNYLQILVSTEVLKWILCEYQVYTQGVILSCVGMARPGRIYRQTFNT